MIQRSVPVATDAVYLGKGIVPGGLPGIAPNGLVTRGVRLVVALLALERQALAS